MSPVVPARPTNLSVAIDVEKLLAETNLFENLESCFRVCVCRVPKSLRFSKPRAFIPHFVGLGPYHHFSDGLIMSTKLKLAAAKRILKDRFPNQWGEFQRRLKNNASGMRALYHEHEDATLSDDVLVSVLAVDGLFLLGLLQSDVPTGPAEQCCFLTGRYGLPLVNAVGVELTMDAIIKDVFMLQNQIPTFVLQQIQLNIMDEIQSQDHLG